MDHRDCHLGLRSPRARFRGSLRQTRWDCRATARWDRPVPPPRKPISRLRTRRRCFWYEKVAEITLVSPFGIAKVMSIWRSISTRGLAGTTEYRACLRSWRIVLSTARAYNLSNLMGEPILSSGLRSSVRCVAEPGPSGLTNRRAQTLRVWRPARDKAATFDDRPAPIGRSEAGSARTPLDRESQRQRQKG
jgi:hypothetical protein